MLVWLFMIEGYHNEMTIQMANAFMSDTWGTCTVATTGVVVLVILIFNFRSTKIAPYFYFQNALLLRYLLRF